MINRIYVRGVIVSMTHGKAGHILVATKTTFRKFEHSILKDAVKDDYITFHYNESSATENISKDFKVGMRVTILGHIASYLRMAECGKSVELMNCYIDTIQRTKSGFEETFGISSGNSYPPSTNEVYFQGIVCNISHFEKAGKRNQAVTESILLKVRIPGNKPNYVSFMLYDGNVEKAKRIKLGDVVCVSGQFRTKDNVESTSTKEINSIHVTGFATPEDFLSEAHHEELDLPVVS